MLRFNIDIPAAAYRATLDQSYVTPKLAHKADMVLLDDIAQDVSRITGIPWSYERVETKQPKRPCINLFNLDPIDRLRVSFALITGHYMLDILEGVVCSDCYRSDGHDADCFYHGPY